MARLARVIAENIPHHIVQRGNRAQLVFFSDSDKRAYLKIFHQNTKKYDVVVWAYCLMDNHVHFVCVPKTAEGLSKCFQETNKSYTRMVNFREGWRGGMWESRFKSFPLDEPYLYSAVRYVERNPVKAGLVKKAGDYPFSSAFSRINKTKDELLDSFFMTEDVEDWGGYLSQDGECDLIQKHLNTGRPLGDISFVEKIENRLKRVIKKRKPGPKAIIK